jgi:hypothetical protein
MTSNQILNENIMLLLSKQLKSGIFITILFEPRILIRQIHKSKMTILYMKQIFARLINKYLKKILKFALPKLLPRKDTLEPRHLVLNQ